MHENEINELRGLWDDLNERILEKKNAEKAIKELREKAIQILDRIAETEADGELFLDTGEDDPAEDATCLPAKLPTEAEWRSSWIDWAGRNPLLPKGHFGIGKSALVDEWQRRGIDIEKAIRWSHGEWASSERSLDGVEWDVQREEQAIEELAEEEVENDRLDK